MADGRTQSDYIMHKAPPAARQAMDELLMQVSPEELLRWTCEAMAAEGYRAGEPFSDEQMQRTLQALESMHGKGLTGKGKGKGKGEDEATRTVARRPPTT